MTAASSAPRQRAQKNTARLPAAGRILLGVFARLVVLFAIVVPIGLAIGYLGLKHLFWTDTTWLRGALIDQAEKRLGVGASIAGLQTFWDGRNPGIRIQGLTISRPDTSNLYPALRVDSAQLLVSWSSLLRGSIDTKAAQVDGVFALVERSKPNQWQVAGFALDLTKPGEGLLAPWLLRQASLRATNVSIQLVDRVQAQPPLLAELDQIALESKRSQHVFSGGLRHLRLAGKESVALLGPSSVGLQWSSNARQPLALDRWQGNIQWDIKQLDLKAAVPTALSWLALQSQTLSMKKLLGTLSLSGQSVLAGTVSSNGKQSFANAVLERGEVGLVSESLRFGRLGLSRLELRISTETAKQGILFGLDRFRAQLQSHESSANARKGEWIELKRPGQLTLGKVQTGRAAAWRPLNGDFEFASVDLQGISQWIQRSLAPGAIPIDANSAMPIAAWRERLTALAPTGRLIDPVIRFSENSVQCRATFENVSIKAQENRGARLGLPGISRLNGEFKSHVSDGKSSGTFKLFANDSVLEIPRLFEQDKVPLQAASAIGTWSSASDQPLQVTVDELRFENADAKGSARVRYQVGGKGLGLLDVIGEIGKSDALRVHRYLPLALPAQVRDWLKSALIAGELSDTRFRLKGDIFDFPYAVPGSGEFSMQTQVANAEMVFAPNWPAIREVQGVLQLERDSLSLKGRQAKIFDVTLKDTEVSIPRFADGVVKVVGSGIGPGQDMIRYLNETPLGPLLDNFTAQTQVLGQAKLSMNLSVPLNDVAQTRFGGNVEFLNNQIKLDNSLPIFSDVTGFLEFDDKGYGLKEVRTSMLGSPMTVSARSQPDRTFQILSQGSMTANAIKRLSPNLITAFLSGEANYQARVLVDRRKVFVELRSDLVGLASDLPAPLKKADRDALPLVLKISPRLQGGAASERVVGDAIDIKLGPALALLFERERFSPPQGAPQGTPDALRMIRGALGYNLEPTLPEFGMSAAIMADYLDVDAWQRVLATPLSRVLNPEVIKPAQSAEGLRDEGPGLDLVSGFELLPNQLAFSANTVLAGRREFRNLVLGGTREAGNWQFNLSANELNGYAAWLDTASTERSGTFVGRFTRLDLPHGRRAELEAFLQQGEDLMPELDIEADEFTLNGVVMGSLDLVAKNRFDQINPSWEIEALEVSNPDFGFQASGSWRLATAERESRTSLDFRFNVAESGRSLERIGVKNAVRDAPGTMSGNVYWAGSPLAFDQGSLSGAMSVNMQKGQFLRVDAGAAKLVGVLNMQALPRRLFLDFRDVTDEGFAFDSVRGEVKVKDGIAFFNRLTMQGIQAQVLISGQADLGKETQLLEVDVRPEVNAGGASLAYAAIVNPAVGLGTFVAQWLLRRPLQSLFSFKVDISGPWANPVVKTRERPNPSLRDNAFDTAP